MSPALEGAGPNFLELFYHQRQRQPHGDIQQWR